MQIEAFSIVRNSVAEMFRGYSRDAVTITDRLFFAKLADKVANGENIETIVAYCKEQQMIALDDTLHAAQEGVSMDALVLKAEHHKMRLLALLYLIRFMSREDIEDL